MNKLKERWGVSSTFAVVMILVAFSLAGSSILFVKKPLFNFLHIPLDITWWVKVPIFIMIYQVLLLFWGTVLGQFSFFWAKEKKMMRFLFKPFLPKTSS